MRGPSEFHRFIARGGVSTGPCESPPERLIPCSEPPTRLSCGYDALVKICGLSAVTGSVERNLRLIGEIQPTFCQRLAQLADGFWPHAVHLFQVGLL